MKNTISLRWLLLICLAGIQCKSGLVTTSNGCYNLIQSAQGQNKSGDYTDALTNFNEVLKKCDAYDAKEKAYAGKAAAKNGLQQYGDAITSANAGLAINPSSLDNLFEKANAELGLSMLSAAKADLGTITNLTQKNRNVSERATIFAKMAALDSRMQQYADAGNNINQAIALDPNNLDLYVLQGDIAAASGNYNNAIDSYNLAISKGKNDGVAWKGKVEAMIKMNQAKYNTSDAGTLARKMSASEKAALCENITTGQRQGLKDMNIDLLQVALCK